MTLPPPVHDGLTAKPRLLLLIPTSTYRAEAFVRAALRLPLHLSIASEHPSSLSHLHPITLPTFDFADAADTIRRARLLSDMTPIDAVVAVDDQSTLAAALIADALRLRHNPPDAVRATINKFLGRERMRAAGLTVPDVRLLSLDGDGATPALPFPAVVKPLAMSASRGVIRVDDADTLADARRRVAAIVREQTRAADELARTRVLLESYVPGWEVAVEGIVDNGQLHVIAVFDKPDPLEGPYFPETLYVTPSRLSGPLQQRIVQTAAETVRAIGLVHGPAHIELRGNDRDVIPIEIHARSIGGLCSRVIRFADGRSLEDVILEHALGRRGDIPPLADGAAGVWMMQSPRRGRFEGMRGVVAACEVPGVEEVIVSARPGQMLDPLPEGFLYTGFIFARGATPDDVEGSLRGAFSRLEPVIQDSTEATPA